MGSNTLMRILVCGGRDFGDLATAKRMSPLLECNRKYLEEKKIEYQYIMDTLNKLSVQLSKNYNPNDNWLPTDIEIISGMAPGVDTVAIDWAVCNWCKWYEYPADWKKFGKSAGHIRNKQMLVEGRPDLVVAFPGGVGTANMVKIAKAAGVEVMEVSYIS